MPHFSGFPESTIRFLKTLKSNNEREWFNAHKADYEALVREPALAFIEAMADPLRKQSPHFHALAKKVGGSLMRVYRDTRFSNDKTPYKSNIGIQFRHELGKDVHAPGFYLHIEPGSCFIGAGIWHPEGKVLSRIRDFMLDNPAAWKRALAHRPFKANFVLEGDSLKRPPRGYPREHELMLDLMRKDFIACRPFAEREINDQGFVRLVADAFRQTDPFMRYLCTALELNY
ncbi:MAG: DUF2461 domain-containing protein [Gammaproteobacteria bacterium]|nr:DUF2461 domain-containing protein [Gammaproteobacteria bacterium]